MIKYMEKAPPDESIIREEKERAELREIRHAGFEVARKIAAKLDPFLDVTEEDITEGGKLLPVLRFKHRTKIKIDWVWFCGYDFKDSEEIKESVLRHYESYKAGQEYHVRKN